MIKKGEKLHKRNIEISTYEGEDGCFIMEGILKEDRLVDVTGMDGKLRPANTFHHMLVRMNIHKDSMTIRDIEAEIIDAPRDQCWETQSSVQRLKGLSVARGFTREALKRIGGANGCSHIKALVMAMTPAILQGFWVLRMRDPETHEPTDDLAEKYLIDTCWVWRKGGPLTKEFELGESGETRR